MSEFLDEAADAAAEIDELEIFSRAAGGGIWPFVSSVTMSQTIVSNLAA
jgi:hypothetical protein